MKRLVLLIVSGTLVTMVLITGRYWLICILASEMSFYRIMREEGLLHHRGSTKPPREPHAVPRLIASGPNQIWSWDITLLPSRIKGKWHYLYMVMDVWSRLPRPQAERAGGTGCQQSYSSIDGGSQGAAAQEPGAGPRDPAP